LEAFQLLLKRWIRRLQPIPADAAPVIAKLKAAGIQFGVHNHDHEFERLGQTIAGRIVYFVEDGGNDLMLEVDLSGYTHAGVNPIKRMAECKGRTPVIHIKDMEVIPEKHQIPLPWRR